MGRIQEIVVPDILIVIVIVALRSRSLFAAWAALVVSFLRVVSFTGNGLGSSFFSIISLTIASLSISPLIPTIFRLGTIASPSVSPLTTTIFRLGWIASAHFLLISVSNSAYYFFGEPLEPLWLNVMFLCVCSDRLCQKSYQYLTIPFGRDSFYLGFGGAISYGTSWAVHPVSIPSRSMVIFPRHLTAIIATGNLFAVLVTALIPITIIVAAIVVAIVSTRVTSCVCAVASAISASGPASNFTRVTSCICALGPVISALVPAVRG